MMNWILTFYFIGHEPYQVEKTFATQLACEQAGTAMVLATFEKTLYPFAVPPYACKKAQP